MENKFDIDQLKKTWQKENEISRYQDEEILSILNRKSRSYIKLIAWISVSELVFFALLYSLTWINKNSTEGYVQLYKSMGFSLSQAQNIFVQSYDVFKIVGVLISVLFIFIFFKKFKKIKVESNIKNLIVQIISFRKSVNLYIGVNITYYIVFMLFMGLVPLYFKYFQQVEIHREYYMYFIIALSVGTLLGLLVLFVYYRILYGILVGKLSKNLSQLEAIEKLNDE